MNSSIVQVQRPEIIFNDSQVRLLKTTILDEQTSNDELALFSLVCGRTGLDPFARQIYGIRRKGKLTFQTSIDGYRLIADRTRKYAGSDDAVFDEGLNLYQHLQTDRKQPIVATVTVWKLIDGIRCPFTASASWAQYSQERMGKLIETWAKMPHLMLSKCAESLALRKAFPAELSGIYTSEEFPAEQESISDRKLVKPNQSIPRSVEVAPIAKAVTPTASSAVSDTVSLDNKEPRKTLLVTVCEDLKNLRWSKNQLENCLGVNFNKATVDLLTNEELLDFGDFLDCFAATTAEIQRLGYEASTGKTMLKMHFGKETRTDLTLKELEEFLRILQMQ